MKNYLEFEKEIKSMEEEVDGLKSPFGSEGISEVDTKKIQNTQVEINEKLKNQKVDVTLPIRPFQSGKIHPVSQVIDEISSIFSEIGFQLQKGLMLKQNIIILLL